MITEAKWEIWSWSRCS